MYNSAVTLVMLYSTTAMLFLGAITTWVILEQATQQRCTVQPSFHWIHNEQVVSMSGGKHHGCIGYDNGSVVCTGRDNVGQQGTNSPSDVNDLTFSYTNALANLSIIAFAGKYTSCALLANGTAQCWGGGPLDKWAMEPRQQSRSG